MTREPGRFIDGTPDVGLAGLARLMRKLFDPQPQYTKACTCGHHQADHYNERGRCFGGKSCPCIRSKKEKP